MKAREARLRRLAHKQDLALHKLPGDGGWFVIDPTINALVVELDDLNEVENWLQSA